MMTILGNNFVWEQRDKRLDDFPLMDSLWPTFAISAGYLYSSGVAMGLQLSPKMNDLEKK